MISFIIRPFNLHDEIRLLLYSGEFRRHEDISPSQKTGPKGHGTRVVDDAVVAERQNGEVEVEGVASLEEFSVIGQIFHTDRPEIEVDFAPFWVIGGDHKHQLCCNSTNS